MLQNTITKKNSIQKLLFKSQDMKRSIQITKQLWDIRK